MDKRVEGMENRGVMRFGNALLCIFRKEVVEKRLMIGFGVLVAALPYLVILLIRASGVKVLFSPDGVIPGFNNLVQWFFFLLLGVVFPVLLASSSIAGEVEKRTLGFLLSVLPSRSTIWTGKFLACLIIEYGVLFLFILLNPGVTDLSVATFFRFMENDAFWFLVPLVLPLLVLSVVFLSSALINREMPAAMGSILILIFTVSAFSFMVKKLLFDMTAGETVLNLLLMSGGYLIASRRVFMQGDELTTVRRNFGKALLPLLIFFVFFSVFMVFQAHQNPGDSEIVSIRSIGVTRENSGVLTRVTYRNSSDCRLRIYPFGGGVYRDIPLRYALHAVLSMDGKTGVVIRGLRDPGPWAEILRFNESNPLMLVDFDTLRLSPFQNLKSLQGKICLKLTGDKFAVVHHRYDSSLGLPVSEISLYSSSGALLGEFQSKGVPGFNPERIGSMTVQGELYFLYGVLNPGGEFQENEGREIIVERFNFDDKRAERVFEKKISGGGKRIFLSEDGVSPDGSRFLYFILDASGEWSTIAEEKSSGLTRVLGDSLCTVSWFGSGSLVLIINPFTGIDSMILTKLVEVDNGEIVFAELDKYALPLSLNRETGEIACIIRDTHSKFRNYLMIMDLETGAINDLIYIGFINRFPVTPLWVDRDNILLDLDDEVISMGRDGKKTVIYRTSGRNGKDEGG